MVAGTGPDDAPGITAAPPKAGMDAPREADGARSTQTVRVLERETHFAPVRPARDLSHESVDPTGTGPADAGEPDRAVRRALRVLHRVASVVVAARALEHPDHQQGGGHEREEHDPDEEREHPSTVLLAPGEF